MRNFADQFEKTVNSDPAVLSSHIEKQFGPTGDSLYIRGSLTFIDSSVLEIALFANKSSQRIIVDKYRFHYMSNNGRIIFRYDNAPHHPDTTSYPHHKHISGKVNSSSMPTIRDLLNEINAMILRKQP